MTAARYQTIRLSPGKHRSPDDGACVMELASMLAGEPFSDHPKCACPVIGAFLMAYNDSIDDERRQDLYAYASRVVDSDGTSRARQARVALLTAWTIELRRRRLPWSLLPRCLQTISYGLPSEAVGMRAAHEALRHDGRSHAEALALIDDLLMIGMVDNRLPAQARRPAPQSSQPV
jgi:hypothetical protein